jgi:hypothetical protein
MYICVILFALSLPLLFAPALPAQTRYISYLDMPHSGPPVIDMIHALTTVIYCTVYLISAAYVALAIIHSTEYPLSHYLAPAAACFAAATFMRYLCSSKP